MGQRTWTDYISRPESSYLRFYHQDRPVDIVPIHPRMSTLHALFALRNEQAFARALDPSRGQANPQPPLSSSASRSLTRSHIPSVDINSRDWLGRTVLHIACATPEQFALFYVRLLLAHPAINVNVQDAESRWTALHRALYAGNLAAVILLLRRADTDTQLRDYDGYTPFDLYNSTVHGTAPEMDSLQGLSADLFTWGVNRNAALGHGDARDRTYPDQVIVQPSVPPVVESPNRFTPIHVNGISMAKLHTTVITDEPRGNLRVCGFGSGGRLGTGQHTLYSLQPVPNLSVRIAAAALGQDHTLALSADGEVFSWGLNRFAQLGYTIERDEPVQSVARRVLGSLRKELVLGVTACRSASACWTKEDVFTWGTNSGQLGYDHVAQPVQVLPRKVTGVQGVTALALEDSVMACLLETMDVICFRADAHFRVKFPASDLSDLPPYQHPHIVKPAIVKITSTDGVFAALSSRGDIFTFSAPSAPSDASPRPVIKPQRAWSLRKSFDPATDLALGADGTLIICTLSGHVFVRRPGAKAQRIPLIHRVVRVCASSTGAFAALRSTPAPRSICVVGASLSEDMRAVRPWISGGEGEVRAMEATKEMPGDEDENEDDGILEADVATTIRMCALLSETEAPSWHHGADMLIHVAGLHIPAHRVILVARSSALRELLEGNTKTVRDGPVKVTYSTQSRVHISISGCQKMTVLLLLEYLYTDDVPALWDRRVSGPCGECMARAGVTAGVVKTQLEGLARALNLPTLSGALIAPTKRIAAPTFARDMTRLFHDPPSSGDVVLELADRAVSCHSVVLRARSQFFRNFFADEDWTAKRWPVGGMLKVNMRHMEWRAVAFVMIWVYNDKGSELFQNLEDVDSVSELLDLVFAVMAVASELLLDKLMLICSSVILRHVTLQNVASLLASSMYYNALELVQSLQEYIVSNLEAILESHLLDDAPSDLIKALAASVQQQQTEKAPVTRTNLIMNDLLRLHGEWLDLQDIPQPLMRSAPRAPRESPRLSPVGMGKGGPRPPRPHMSPLSSPALITTGAKRSTPGASSSDDIFSMDDDAVPALNIGQPQSPSDEYTLSQTAWKSQTVPAPPRIDMKAILAEAGSTLGVASSTTRPGSEGVEYASTTSKWSHKPSQRERRKLQSHAVEDIDKHVESVPRASTSLGSPWRLHSNQTSTSGSPVSVSVHRPPVAPHSSPSTSRIVGVKIPSPAATPKRPPATPASVPRSPIFPLGFSPAGTNAVQRIPLPDSSAWTKPSVHDPAPSAVSGLSFTAIQQQQRDQGQQPKGKRSLKEIQQEEQARQDEENFMRWWTAEEQRVKAEEAAQIERAVSVDTGESSKRGRDTKKGRRGSIRGRRGNHPGRGRAEIPEGR